VFAFATSWKTIIATFWRFVITFVEISTTIVIHRYIPSSSRLSTSISSQRWSPLLIMVWFFGRNDSLHLGVVFSFKIVLFLIWRLPIICYNPSLYNSRNWLWWCRGVSSGVKHRRPHCGNTFYALITKTKVWCIRSNMKIHWIWKTYHILLHDISNKWNRDEWNNFFFTSYIW